MHTDRKADILESFIRLVSHFGVDKTTMQDVAKDTGLSIGTIYSDFKNKEDLIEAYLDSMGQQIINQYQMLSNEDLPPERLLHHFITGMFEHTGKIVLENRGLCQFIQGTETIKVLHKNFAKNQELNKKVYAMAEKIMARGIQEGAFVIDDPSKTARLFMNAFVVYAKEMFIERDLQKMLQGVEEMYLFVIKAIQKHECEN